VVDNTCMKKAGKEGNSHCDRKQPGDFGEARVGGGTVDLARTGGSGDKSKKKGGNKEKRVAEVQLAEKRRG